MFLAFLPYYLVSWTILLSTLRKHLNFVVNKLLCPKHSTVLWCKYNSCKNKKKKDLSIFFPVMESSQISLSTQNHHWSLINLSIMVCFSKASAWLIFQVTVRNLYTFNKLTQFLLPCFSAPTKDTWQAVRWKGTHNRRVER